jgi:hypothetical protein
MDRRPLYPNDTKKVLLYIEKFWQFPVAMVIESEGKTKITWRVSKGEVING